TSWCPPRWITCAVFWERRRRSARSRRRSSRSASCPGPKSCASSTPSVPQRFDTIVIGAGAAGLSAARELSGAGHRLCLLAARQRLGRRIFTLHTPDLPLPIELGAEFIHGEEPTTFAIVEAAALLAYELPDTHWWL